MHQWPTRVWEAEAQEPLCEWIREGKLRSEDFISAEIEDARIYDKALTVDQLKALKPNEASEIEPYAWWDFESGVISEKTGRYPINLMQNKDDGEIEEGRLILRQWGALMAYGEYIEETPQFPENPPDE